MLILHLMYCYLEYNFMILQKLLQTFPPVQYQQKDDLISNLKSVQGLVREEAAWNEEVIKVYTSPDLAFKVMCK